MNKEDLSIKGMVKILFDMIEKVEEKYYNGNVFEMAMYLYMRYGEIPLELENDKDLEEVHGILLGSEYSLFNNEINEKVEDLILGKEDENELL